MFALYQLFYWTDPLNMYRGEVAWFFSFILGTLEAHYVHRRVTFKSNTPYGESLYWMFFVYTIILVLSTLTISSLIRTFEVQYQIAWVINNCIFGLVYFAGLRLLAFPPEVDAEA
jgi:putative flippase GtrA